MCIMKCLRSMSIVRPNYLVCIDAREFKEIYNLFTWVKLDHFFMCQKEMLKITIESGPIRGANCISSLVCLPPIIQPL